MSRSIPAPPAGARTRHWRVPPPLVREGEILEGSEILEEVPGEVGALLWKSLRSVTLWAAVAPENRAQLFAPEAGRRRMAEILATPMAPELRRPLEGLATVLENPAGVARETVALFCRQVAQQAANSGAHATELAFIQAGALANPLDADMAYEVGRLTRVRGEQARAETWYRRAIMLGRQVRNWSAYCRGYIGLGGTAKRRGNLPAARRACTKALRTANRHGLRDEKARALHDLFTIAVECEDASTAQSLADQAYRTYPPGHQNIRYVAHDLCCLWMREGQFKRALKVLRPLMPLFAENERLLIAANTARAAGGVPDQNAFDQAWEEAMAGLDRTQVSGTIPQALLSLARGATGMGEWERAVEMGERALAAATASGNGHVVFAAESVLAFARSRRAAETHVDHDATEPLELEAEKLACDLVQEFETAAAGV